MIYEVFMPKKKRQSRVVTFRLYAFDDEKDKKVDQVLSEVPDQSRFIREALYDKIMGATREAQSYAPFSNDVVPPPDVVAPDSCSESTSPAPQSEDVDTSSLFQGGSEFKKPEQKEEPDLSDLGGLFPDFGD
jgi:hypothetical protein